MPSFFKRLGFFLSGGIPKTSTYELRRAARERKWEEHQKLKDSENIHRYNELAAQLVTPASQSGLKGKERKALKMELKEIAKSDDVKSFFKLQKETSNFKDISGWELIFSDDFEGDKLSKKLWQTHPSLGGKLPDLLYSPANEKQVFTDGDNIEVSNKSVKLVTKKESGKGLAFGDQHGFIPVERDYTSGIINTGNSHKQLYGKVEARIRFNQPSKAVYHSMWMSAGGLLPHLNIIRIGTKLEFSVFNEGKEKGEAPESYIGIQPRNYLRQNTYYVFTVEWNEKVIIWKINGRKMYSAPNIVNEPMYIAFSSGITAEPSNNRHSILEVDWVRAYKSEEKV
jgi:beta-glucanase (GH16 family)